MYNVSILLVNIALCVHHLGSCQWSTRF